MLLSQKYDFIRLNKISIAETKTHNKFYQYPRILCGYVFSGIYLLDNRKKNIEVYNFLTKKLNNMSHILLIHDIHSAIIMLKKRIDEI